MVVLLTILVGGAWWGWNSLINSSAGPTCVEQQLPNNRLVPKQVSVNVYNGGARAGTAAKVAELLPQTRLPRRQGRQRTQRQQGRRRRAPRQRHQRPRAPTGRRPTGPKARPRSRRPRQPHRRPSRRHQVHATQRQGPGLHRRPRRHPRLPPRHLHPPTHPQGPKPQLTLPDPHTGFTHRAPSSEPTVRVALACSRVGPVGCWKSITRSTVLPLADWRQSAPARVAPACSASGFSEIRGLVRRTSRPGGRLGRRRGGGGRSGRGAGWG